MRCPNCAAENIEGVDLCEECGTDLAGLDLPEAQGGWSARLLTSRLGDYEVSEAVIVAPDETVRGAIERMREAQAGCVLVREEGALVGLFNERHVLTRVLRAGLDPGSTLVSQVMSPDPLCLSPEDPPAFAIHCMVARGFRHLPLVAGGEILGYISVRNVLALLRQRVLAEEPA